MVTRNIGNIDIRYVISNYFQEKIIENLSKSSYEADFYNLFNKFPV